MIAPALAGALLVLNLLAAAGSAWADPYEVQPGDSLSSIAQRHGVTQGVLLALNPQITSADSIYVGQLLELPDNAVYLPSLTRITHLVAPGDTVSGLALHYGVTVSDIVRLNPEINVDVLWVGTELVIRDDFAAAATAEADEPPAEEAVGGTNPSGGNDPGDEPAAAGGPSIAGIPVRIHRIADGDTFSSIAQQYGTSVETLILFNPSLRPDSLFVGAILWVPRSPATADVPRVRLAAGAPSAVPTIPYVVIAGDSATVIARDHGLSLAQLGRLNPDADLGVVFVGQILRVPGQAGTASAPDGGGPGTQPEPTASVELVEYTTYIVAPGDTGYGVAAYFELELNELALLNPAVNVNSLLIGQSLTVPKVDRPPPPPGTAPAGPPPPNRYTVAVGDNLTAIANAQGTTNDAILSLNPGLDPNLLRVDQELILPGSMPLPVVSRTVATSFGRSLEDLAADLGLLPHTLLANNPSLGGWVPAGTRLIVPFREALLITVQPGDTLQGIANQFGSSVERLANDAGTGVIGPNQLVVGQELAIPIAIPAFGSPLDDYIPTDGFGLCRTADCSVVHKGTDLSRGLGSPVYAIAGGTVSFVGGSYCCGLGFHVMVQHANGFESLYGHLNGAPPVLLGQTVARGDVIGYVGTTGFSTGPHLHLELTHNDWLLDALNYIP